MGLGSSANSGAPDSIPAGDPHIEGLDTTRRLGKEGRGAQEGSGSTPSQRGGCSRNSRDLLIIFIARAGISRGPELSSRLPPVTWSKRGEKHQLRSARQNQAFPQKNSMGKALPVAPGDPTLQGATTSSQEEQDPPAPPHRRLPPGLFPFKYGFP